MTILKRILGSSNDRQIKRYEQAVSKINILENKFSTMDDITLKNQRLLHMERAKAEGRSPSLVEDSFAYVREVSKRILGLRHFDVQLIGGLVINDGKVAEMRTGEGKTLVATLPSYYNSLFGAVHVVTANDYLAKRDSETMDPLYSFLGMTVDYVVNGKDQSERISAYSSDVVYSTSSELGFDYLRDHTATEPEHCVQKNRLDFVIVDELDSVLIDEARTPLVISSQTETKQEEYMIAYDAAKQFNMVNITDLAIEGGEKRLAEADFDAVYDYKKHHIDITESGFEKAEDYFVSKGFLKHKRAMYTTEGLRWGHLLRVMLISMSFYKKDIDYILTTEGEVKIIDESTGRIMEGRRWNDGIHQCIETIEGVTVNPESINVASITIQNFFKLYNKTSGMTGTAYTEALELNDIYDLDVVVVPTNQPVIRDDDRDKMFLNLEAKTKFLIKDIIKSNDNGQPILIGTDSVDMSERISKALYAKNINHQVLNAKKHQQEASIIAQAGRPGAITIATNMAGRGTDIILGGNPGALVNMLESPSEEECGAVYAKCKKDQQKVLQSGGLRVIGTARHQTRRIDNQLIGRAGRQGDPGSSVFYISLDDDLLSKFVHNTQKRMLVSLGLNEDDYLSGQMINSVVRKSQQVTESIFFDIRKEMLEFDNVINEQRSVVYKIRDEVLYSNDFMGIFHENINHMTKDLVAEYIMSNTRSDHWRIDELRSRIFELFNMNLELGTDDDIKALTHHEFEDRLNRHFKTVGSHFITTFGEEFMMHLAKQVLLSAMDQHWREHMNLMNELLSGIHLRGYINKNPKQEYKREAFLLFKSMQANISEQFVTLMFLNANRMMIDELAKNNSPVHLIAKKEVI
jgi:preprotein translocase subunit SecA